MKHKTIKTDKATVLVVELLEGAINPVVSMGYITARVPNNIYKTYDDWAKKLDVGGDWKHLGAVSDVAEEQAAGLVDAYEVSHNLDLTVTYAFKDYVNGIAEENNVDWDYLDEYPFDTALESLHSLLEANGWDGETSRTHLFIKQK